MGYRGVVIGGKLAGQEIVAERASLPLDGVRYNFEPTLKVWVQEGWSPDDAIQAMRDFYRNAPMLAVMSEGADASRFLKEMASDARVTRTGVGQYDITIT